MIYLLIAKGQSTSGNTNFRKQMEGNRQRFYITLLCRVKIVQLMPFYLSDFSRRISKLPLVK